VAELGDSGMTAAVSEALASNPGLKAAAARMRAAGEESMVVRAARLPKVGANGSGGLSDRSGGETQVSYGLNLAASWEADLWGRLRDLDEAAVADGKAAREDFRGARLSLAANTAKAWCNLVSAGQELELAKLTLNSFEKNLRIIERNYRGTGEGALDLRFGRTNVASARRSVEARKHERNEAARTLQVMLGRYPDGLVATPPELPALKGEVPAGLPTGLLERRADLAAARARLTASARRADAARVALLPDIALTAGGGMTSARFAELLDLDGLVGSVTARVSQVVFEGGAAEAQARAARERNEALVQDYCRLALEAFREVESALAAEGSLRRQEQILGEEVAQAALGERQAERDYAEGVNPNILSVLEAQRRANNAKAAKIRLGNQRLLNRINLHLALGGDFRTLS
jgi:NodT family efflux transporter outer membrane factor (OMF) lipoprotein